MTKESRLSVNLKLIFLLLLLENVATTPVVNLLKTAVESKKNDSACKFLFHVKGDNENGQFYVTGITMPPLEQIIKQTGENNNDNNNDKVITTSSVGANCIPEFMVEQKSERVTKSKRSTDKKFKKLAKQHTWSIYQKNSEEDSSEEEIDGTHFDPSQPVYEEQVVVFPLDDEKIQDIFSTTTSTTTRKTSITPTRTTSATSTSTTTRPKTVEKVQEKSGVKVEENYRYYQPDGTGEYKLMLSNGVTDYKRIYKKKVGDKEIIAQSGYYTVPRTDNEKGFNIQYYVADENGQRVYTDKS